MSAFMDGILAILQFIFASPWRWLGTLVIIAVIVCGPSVYRRRD